MTTDGCLFTMLGDSRVLVCRSVLGRNITTSDSTAATCRLAAFHDDLLSSILLVVWICLVLYPEVKELGVSWIDSLSVLDDIAAKDFVIAWRVSVAHSGIPPFCIPRPCLNLRQQPMGIWHVPLARIRFGQRMLKLCSRVLKFVLVSSALIEKGVDGCFIVGISIFPI